MIKNQIKIIAEIGVNHNGSLKIAKKLIDEAKKCNADYVKFQTFRAKNLVTKNLSVLKYQKNKKHQKQLSLLKSVEISEKNFFILKKHAEKRKIEFLCTPFDIESAIFLKKLGLKIFKLPSGEINNYPLLELISKISKKVILSTGMSTLKEIKYALNVLTQNKLKKKDITVLHCTTQYPAKLKNINLSAIKTIKKNLNISVGYSDHTETDLTSILAAGMGAEIIEKHITLSKKMFGPDHKASMEIEDFKKFVENLKKVKIILGKHIKAPTKDEKKYKNFIRKSIVAKKNIKKGEKFNTHNITTKRPEGGISPVNWRKIIGKKSKKNYLIDDFI